VWVCRRRGARAAAIWGEMHTVVPYSGARSGQSKRRRLDRASARVAALLAMAVATALTFASPALGGPPPTRIGLSGASRSAAACVWQPTLAGPPSQPLLSALAVLRRPATVGDAPEGLLRAMATVDHSLGAEVFVAYVRRARVVAGNTYYIVPTRYTDCGLAGSAPKPFDGIDVEAIGVAGHRAYGGTTVAQIEQGRSGGAGQPGSATASTLVLLLPDGVARVKLHYAAGSANGFTRVIAAPFTTTTTPVNNLIVVSIPRSSSRALVFASTT